MRRIVAVASLVCALLLVAAPGWWWLWSWVPFGVGAWTVMRLPARTALALILVGGAALPLVAGLRPPSTSDDMYRYVWDGRVQHAGVDPYRYPPSAPELTGLRDPFLWPAKAPWCIPSGCTRINRPTVPTIYPPVAEAVFVAVDVLSPAHSREGPMQLTMAGFALAVGLFLWYGLKRLNRDPRRAVLWAWCPLVALESGNNAHVDVVAVLLAAVALWFLARGKAVAGGVALGLAIATKLTPGLLVPAVVRRRPLAVLLAVVGAVVTVYVPHLLAAGDKVIGYLPGYLHEEGFTDGARFGLVSAVLPKAFVAPVAVLVLAVAAVLAWRVADPDRPWRAAAALVVVTLLVTTPSYPWYVLLLVMLVAYGAPVEWLVLVGGAYTAQFALNLHLSPLSGQRLGYGVALAVVAGGLALRSRTLTRSEQLSDIGRP